jgi:hypothetical protein
MSGNGGAALIRITPGIEYGKKEGRERYTKLKVGRERKEEHIIIGYIGIKYTAWLNMGSGAQTLASCA